jgi:hypothetical protein
MPRFPFENEEESGKGDKDNNDARERVRLKMWQKH